MTICWQEPPEPPATSARMGDGEGLTLRLRELTPMGAQGAQRLQ